MKKKRSYDLYGVAKFALFATSYAPLFVLVIIKQVYENRSFLHYGGVNTEAIMCFFSSFFVSLVALGILIFGIIGCLLLFSNLKKKRGDNVTITNVSNRNSESIGYVATYIIPLVFQSFSSLYEVLAIIFIFAIIYSIYANSNMLLINPALNLFHYSIFEIQYKYKDKERTGLIIIHNSEVEEESIVNIYQIGFKLFYASNNQ